MPTAAQELWNLVFLKVNDLFCLSKSKHEAKNLPVIEKVIVIVIITVLVIVIVIITIFAKVVCNCNDYIQNVIITITNYFSKYCNDYNYDY